MKKYLTILKKVFRNKNYIMVFLISSILYGILYAAMTNLIDLRLGLRYINISFTIVSSIFFVLFGILGGILITLQIFAIRNREKSLSSAHVGFVGAFLSFFNTTCPFCKPLLLSLLGISGSVAILKYGFAFAIISILLLLGSIALVLNNINKSKCCEVKL